MSSEMMGAPCRRPSLTVVVCCYNGAEGLEATLAALKAQTVAEQVDILVVDDGSTDGSADVARGAGARVVVHPINQGLAAARNTGLRSALGDLVAFTDDDCLPEPRWLECLLDAVERHPGAFAWGGPAVAVESPGWVSAYLRHADPMAPLERSLLDDDGFVHRLRQYLLRNGAQAPAGEREVASVAGANMMLRRELALEIGGYDERFRFGGEEEELFRRVVRAGHQVVFVPDAQVRHRYLGTLSDTIRRSRAYGRGNARMRAKHPDLLPTIYPAPVLVAGLLAGGIRRPALMLVAVVLPQVLFSRWVRKAATQRKPIMLTYPYIQLLQEAASNLGWIDFLRKERRSFDKAH